MLKANVYCFPFYMLYGTVLRKCRKGKIINGTSIISNTKTLIMTYNTFKIEDKIENSVGLFIESLVYWSLLEDTYTPAA